MASSNLRLIKRTAEYLDKTHIHEVPSYTRGIYVLTKYRKRTGAYNVVYIGMVGGSKAGIRSRLT